MCWYVSRKEIAPALAHLDTMIIEPDRMRATLVWRTTVPVEPEVRVLEARLIRRCASECINPQRAALPPPHYTEYKLKLLEDGLGDRPSHTVAQPTKLPIAA